MMSLKGTTMRQDGDDQTACLEQGPASYFLRVHRHAFLQCSGRECSTRDLTLKPVAGRGIIPFPRYQRDM